MTYVKLMSTSDNKMFTHELQGVKLMAHSLHVVTMGYLTTPEHPIWVPLPSSLSYSCHWDLWTPPPSSSFCFPFPPLGVGRSSMAHSGGVRHMMPCEGEGEQEMQNGGTCTTVGKGPLPAWCSSAMCVCMSQLFRTCTAWTYFNILRVALIS